MRTWTEATSQGPGLGLASAPGKVGVARGRPALAQPSPALDSRPPTPDPRPPTRAPRPAPGPEPHFSTSADFMMWVLVAVSVQGPKEKSRWLLWKPWIIMAAAGAARSGLERRRQRTPVSPPLRPGPLGFQAVTMPRPAPPSAPTPALLSALFSALRFLLPGAGAKAA